MKIIHKVIYTCKDASKFMVQKGEVKLSIIQRLRLWMHLQVCDACRRFNIQNEWIDQQLTNLMPDEHDHLNPNKKVEMEKTLKTEIEN